MSQLKRENPQQAQRSAGGFRCARTDLPQAPLMQPSTSQGQRSQGWPRICACREQAVPGEVDPWGLRAPSTSGSLFISKETLLYMPVCLQCPQTPYDGDEIRAALQAAAEPGVPLLRVPFLSPLPASAGARPSPFFSPSFPCSGVVSLGSGLHRVFHFPHGLETGPETCSWAELLDHFCISSHPAQADATPCRKKRNSPGVGVHWWAEKFALLLSLSCVEAQHCPAPSAHVYAFSQSTCAVRSAGCSATFVAPASSETTQTQCTRPGCASYSSD